VRVVVLEGMASSLNGASSDSELVTQWLRGRPDSTRRAYEPVALTFVKALGPEGIKSATVERVTSYVEALVGEPATRARLVSTIKSLLSWAWRTGYTTVNVGRALRCVRVPGSLHKKLLEEPEVKALCGASQGRDHALLVLLYVSGIRISEAVGLNVGDLRGCHVTVLGKGTRTRTVLIPASVADLLRTLSSGHEDKPGRPFFISTTTGDRLGVRAAREAVYKAAEKVGKDTLSPHWLRHAHATHALDRGCPIHVVQQSLGHATVATTSKYLHVRPTVGASQWLSSPV
jgi:integrase/recombinase XerD